MNELSAVMRFGLLMLRPGMLMVAAPAFGSDFAPAPVKVGLTALIAIVLAPHVAIPDSLSMGATVMVVARELVIGLSLAFAIRLLLAAVEFAGHLSGFQIGFSYASLIDPQTGARNTTVSRLYSLMALYVFLMTDSHHQMLRALSDSYTELPVGAWALSGNLAVLCARILGMVFTFGMQLAAPVMLVLLTVELMLGLMARAMPSLNLMVSAMPVRILIGLWAIVSTLEIVPGIVRSGIGPAFELSARLAAAFR